MYGTEVTTFRRSDSHWSEEVLIHLPDQTRCGLPAWMLDENYCRKLADQDQPLIALEAFLELRKLLDIQQGLGRSSVHEKNPCACAKSAPTDSGSPTAAATNVSPTNVASNSPAMP